MPGDRISIKDGVVFVNQKKLSETYISKDEITNPGKFIKEGQEVNIPTDSYFVMGDNRNHSLDSRNFGFITKDKITGRAWLVYWPPPETGIISPPVFQ